MHWMPLGQQNVFPLVKQTSWVALGKPGCSLRKHPPQSTSQGLWWLLSSATTQVACLLLRSFVRIPDQALFSLIWHSLWDAYSLFPLLRPGFFIIIIIIIWINWQRREFCGYCLFLQVTWSLLKSNHCCLTWFSLNPKCPGFFLHKLSPGEGMKLRTPVKRIGSTPLRASSSCTRCFLTHTISNSSQPWEAGVIFFILTSEETEAGWNGEVSTPATKPIMAEPRTQFIRKQLKCQWDSFNDLYYESQVANQNRTNHFLTIAIRLE